MSIRTVFIPTPQIEQFSNYYLVQLLAKHRVLCMGKGEPFTDTSAELVEKYLTIPVGLTTAKEVLASFKLLEQVPIYEQAMKQLKAYEGHQLEVSSVTTSGLMVLIEVPEPVAA